MMRAEIYLKIEFAKKNLRKITILVERIFIL